MINIESIKGKIRSMAEKKNLKSQEVLQIYFFERFLERLSKSPYKNNFVIKGGFLISSLIGIENRTTMDMDTTIKGIALKEEKIKEVVEEIINIDVDDGIRFEIKDISYIREDDEYENFRISLTSNVGKTKNPMKLDLTTGDAITLRDIEYTYPCIFSKEDIKNNSIYIRNNFSGKIRNHNQKKYNNNTNERLLRSIHPLQTKKR